MDAKYTVEELLLDETFLDYCANKNSIYKHKWEQIIGQYSPSELKIIEEAKEFLLLLNPVLSTEEIEAEVNKVREIIHSENKKELTKSTDNSPVSKYLYVDSKANLRGRRVKRLMVYGSVLIALSLSIGYLVNSGVKNKAEENRLAEITQYQSPRTERKQVELPDGSLVILNTNSTISISAEYNKTNREIQLSGDALFKVIKNTAKPFIVLTPTFSTTALGTTFYVHARDKNKNYSVELLEGSVKLSANDIIGSKAFLSPGEKGQWHQAQSAFTTNKFDTVELKQWISGTISFNKTPVHQAIKLLEKWYAIEIDLEKKNWENTPITGDYANKPLDDVLKVICFSLSCQYRYSGNKVIIQ